MTTETLRTIVDGLNSAPFNRNFSLVTFDSLQSDKLLQTLSDVLCWIQAIPEVDIRSETPDETAMRILNALRILKYPPPRDMDHIQRWRLEILEGEKSAIYPVLEWIFNNVDRLKERVYLARYLTRIEVPPEEVTPDIQRVQNAISNKMEEFKHIHSRIVESRSDFSRAEDIRADLKAMEEEKEQLQRKIDRVKRIAAGRGDNINRYLEMAAKLRAESERGEMLMHEKQTQRNALVHIEQRVHRLNRMKNELEKEKDNINPQNLIEKLKREIDTNSYIIEEKLAKDIEIMQKNIKSVNKILNMQTVTNNDIINFKKRIEALNNDIIQITTQRDKKDEEHEDKLSIYRHQSINIQRKKQAIAEKMQLSKRELDEMEVILANKKADLAKKAGTDEIVTAVQFKRYISELRAKTTTYKRRKAEMEEIENEVKILQRTTEILDEEWNSLKQKITSAGHGVIENLNAQNARPKTAKPTTNDVNNLKTMAKDLNDQVSNKRDEVQKIKEEFEEFAQRHRKANEEYESKRSQYTIMKNELENEQHEIEEEVKHLETQNNKLIQEKLKAESELSDKEWLKESIENPSKATEILQEINQKHSQTLFEIEKLRSKLTELSGKANGKEQIQMWKSLIAIFEKKIELSRKNSTEAPFGDSMY
uniref:IFT81 calponin homology domain-containing protein n=1 Tax=Panagrolaimus sp. PS1159 TaxID=55785 RepID=A0AC35GLE4_9BILA